MLTLSTIIYLFMCWISNWNLLWPITMLIDGGLGRLGSIEIDYPGKKRIIIHNHDLP